MSAKTRDNFLNESMIPKTQYFSNHRRQISIHKNTNSKSVTAANILTIDIN